MHRWPILILLLLVDVAWAQRAPVRGTTKQPLQRKRILKAKPKAKPVVVVPAPVEEVAPESSLKFEASGNLEGQTRALWNQSSAKRFPLLQDWQHSQFHVASGNLNLKAEFAESRVETNLFARYAQSELYQEGYLAPQVLNFPRKLVARDVFRLDHSRQYGNAQADLVINKLYYELDGEESRFVFGRMYINYGTGEVFNPVNPYNQPLGLTSQSNVAQGNDGFKVSFFTSDESSLNFYLLGNKNLDDYENQITQTLWLHGELRPGENWQIDYVLGQDQKRNKAGGQVNYIWGDAMVFTQLLYSSAFTTSKPSENLIDAMVGYDNQLTGLWHLRIEAGHQEPDDEYVIVDPASASDRLLPYESFVAVAQTYEIHPLVKLSATLIYDFKTDFTYGLGRASWSVVKDVEWDFFVNSPLYWVEDEVNVVQKLFPTEAGTALRVFF
jgi:hypothetical protein